MERSPKGGIFRRGDDFARLLRRADVRRDHAERAAVERPRDVLGPGARHPHEGGDADLERRDADLARRFQRQARMLDVHVDRIEAGGLRDSRDLDRAHQTHGHRRDDLAARELLFHVVAHDFPRRRGHVISS